MDWDDVKAPAPVVTIGEDLSTLSVDELEQRIKELRAEIERVTAEMDTKRKHEAAAAAVFKT